MNYLFLLFKKGIKLKVPTLFLLTCFIAFVFAEEKCKFRYTGPLEDLHETTISVPGEMVAVSNKVQARSGTFYDTVSETPAIFFVIDHSSSMSWESGVNDKDGNRFTVPYALIDSIYKKYPSAEVGMAVFQRYLYFRPEDDSRFKQCPSQDSGAYIPLYKLDQQYGNESGYAILRKMLLTEQRTSPTNDEYTDLTYQPSARWPDWRSPGTHINAGFQAAMHAMKSSSYLPKNRYIIFLSDGSPTWPGGSVGNDFASYDSVPTTFTIFFTKSITVPDIIDSMTNNIRRQSYYSTSNKNSEAWPFFNSSPEALMGLVMDSIFSEIGQNRISRPFTMTIGGVSVGNWDSTGFSFNTLFPLKAVTTFNASITYKIYDDNSVYVRDSIQPVNNFKVEIDTSLRLNEMPANFEVKCWNRDLGFYYNNTLLTILDQSAKKPEIRFTYDPKQANYHYSNATVEIRSKKTGDKEVFNLTKNNNYFSYHFDIENGIYSAGDGTLQHDYPDTLMATFRNNENPKLTLDTLVKQIPIGFGYSIDIIATNPFNINDFNIIDSIPHVIIDALDPVNELDLINSGNRVGNSYYGMVIQIKPDDDCVNLLDRNFEMSGKISIYDALGNQIITDRPMGFYKDLSNPTHKMSLNYAWNGQNHNKRDVGRGTYLAVCAVTIYEFGENGSVKKEEVKKVLLGIKD